MFVYQDTGILHFYLFLTVQLIFEQMCLKLLLLKANHAELKSIGIFINCVIGIFDIFYLFVFKNMPYQLYTYLKQFEQKITVWQGCIVYMDIEPYTVYWVRYI